MWLCLSHNVVGINLKTGAVKQTVPFKGRLSAFTPGESTLLVVSEKVPTKKIVTQINLGSGEAKTSEVASSLREKVPTSKDLPSDVLPTAALLLKREMDAQEKNGPSIYKFSSEFFPAGQNMVEMQVKLVEAKVGFGANDESGRAIEFKSGHARFHERARGVAEEIFNDLKRSATGGYKRVDESRYSVLLAPSLENDAMDWTGEITGLPVFFTQKTVDVLVGGKSVILFDKQNKKLGEANSIFRSMMVLLRVTAAEEDLLALNRTILCCFFDQGVLTAFDLPAGAVRWRLPSVGISGIQFDDKGNVVCEHNDGVA